VRQRPGLDRLSDYLRKLDPFVAALRIRQVERDAFFRREPHVERTLGAIDAWTDHRIELESDAELVFHESLHRRDLVAVGRHRDGLERERQPPIEQEMDTAHALVKRA